LWTVVGERAGAAAGRDSLEASVPAVAATMRRYLDQLACVLRPGSVGGADLALRSLAAFLVERVPHVIRIADVGRHEIEDFVRISEWGWPDAPTRVPIIASDLPRQDHPLPKALDDAAAAKLLRAAQAQRRLLVRVVVEVLLRTGLRVGEFSALTRDAVVLIGAAPWLHVPVGKLHEDRYLPLHPHVLTLIGDYRTQHVSSDNPLLLPRENGRPLDRHTVTRLINKPVPPPGWRTSTRTNSGTPSPPRPSTAA
jgi:integrase